MSTQIKTLSILAVFSLFSASCASKQQTPVRVVDYYPELKRQGNPNALQKLKYGFIARDGHPINAYPSPSLPNQDSDFKSVR